MGDAQILINIIVGIAGTLSVFVLTAVWSRLGKLENSDANLTIEIHKMRELVAGEYIKRAEVAPQLEKIYDTLEIIRTELGKKVERRES